MFLLTSVLSCCHFMLVSATNVSYPAFYVCILYPWQQSPAYLLVSMTTVTCLSCPAFSARVAMTTDTYSSWLASPCIFCLYPWQQTTSHLAMHFLHVYPWQQRPTHLGLHHPAFSACIHGNPAFYACIHDNRHLLTLACYTLNFLLVSMTTDNYPSCPAFYAFLLWVDRVAQSVQHWTRDPKTWDSNPVSSTRKICMSFFSEWKMCWLVGVPNRHVYMHTCGPDLAFVVRGTLKAIIN